MNYYTYSLFYRTLNLPVPVGSRNVAGTFGGTPCPMNINFGRVHGASPARGSVQFIGSYNVQAGSQQSLQIGNSEFIGLVVIADTTDDMENGMTTKFELVDMRDRLHDKNVYGQLNMMDDDGKFYHIRIDHDPDSRGRVPQGVGQEGKYWDFQIKTIVRNVKPNDFQTLDDSVDMEFQSANTKLYSGFTILSTLATMFNFEFSASSMAYNILKYSRPENLDWNKGVKIIDAIQSVIEKNGLQMTAWGPKPHIHITLRGFNDNPFLNRILSADPCTFPFFTGGQKGQELNDKGRHVTIIGERNKWEDKYAAIPNWNKKFTLAVCLGWELSAVLTANELTLHSKLGDLPSEWHDPEKWKGKPRNELTIEEYIKEICFRVFVVDYSTPVGVDENGEVHELYDPEDGTYYTDPADGPLYNFYDKDPFEKDDQERRYSSPYPLAPELVSDSERQTHVYTSYKKIRVKGWIDPFDMDTEQLVAQADGVSVDVETRANLYSSEEEYRIRLIFSDMRFVITLPPENTLPQDREKLTNYNSDRVVAVLAFEQDVYKYSKGEQSELPRIREKRQTVAKLRKNYLYGEEVPLLSAYYRDEEEFDNATSMADDIADCIADQLLYHEMITTTGVMNFDQECGFMCDGVIESVSTTFDENNGVAEVLNLTSEANDPSISGIVIGVPVKSKFKDYNEIVAHERNQRAIAAMRDWKNKQQIQYNAANASDKIAQGNNWIDRSNQLGSDNAIQVRILAGTVETEEEFFAGELLVLGRPGYGDDQLIEDYISGGDYPEQQYDPNANKNPFNYKAQYQVG